MTLAIHGLMAEGKPVSPEAVVVKAAGPGPRRGRPRTLAGGLPGRPALILIPDEAHELGRHANRLRYGEEPKPTP